jgi:hypothetical protein
MPNIVSTVRDAAYTALGVQVLSYERMMDQVNEMFSLDEVFEEARAKGRPAFDRLSESADAIASRLGWKPPTSATPATQTASKATPSAASSTKRATKSTARKATPRKTVKRAAKS